VTIIILYLLTGVVAGTLSGMLGIGGGSIIVPMMSLTNGVSGTDTSVSMHIAAGTSLCVMIFTSYASVRAHHLHERVDFELFKRLIPGICVGVVSGVLVADLLPTTLLRVFFGIFLILVAMRTFIIFGVNHTHKLPGPVVMTMSSVVIGFNSGILGVGGGMLLMPFLTSCNVPMRKAVCVTALCSLVLAIFGTAACMITGSDELHIPSWHTGYINWTAALSIASTSIIFAPIGAWFSHRLPIALLKRIFATVILVAGVHMLWQ
jgi:uncharacterized protein